MREADQFSLAVGFFDGVHLGHQAILRGASAALTFENHPLSVLAPDRAPRLLMSWEDRAKAVMALGVKVTALEFDQDLAARPPEDFLELMRGLADGAPLAVRCGANWRFGKDGAGDADWLRARGVPVTVVPYVDYQGEPISSTRIRAALERGELDAAAAMLGRPYALSGETFRGKGLGRGLGFPTVNIRPSLPDPVLPAGVYVVELEGRKGVANYGLAPTAGEHAWTKPVLEVHLLGGAEPPAGTGTCSVSFLRYLRPERKFASLDELKDRIARDIEEAGA